MPSRRHGTLAALAAALLLLLLPAVAGAAPPTCSPVAARADGSPVASATFPTPSCLDQRGDPVVPRVTVQPVNGLLTARFGGWSYTSGAATGTRDKAGFVATDPVTGELSQTLWVQLGVRALPVPSCSALAPVSVRPGRVGRSAVDCVDGDPLGTGFGIAVVHAPDAVGTIDMPALAAGSVRFVAGDVAGSDVLDLRISNAAGSSELVSQRFVVDPAYNSAPTCVGGSRGVRPGDTVEVALRCSDADEDPLGISVLTPTAGTVSTVTAASGSRPASVRYTAPAGAATAELRFTASDGSATSTAGSYTISVDPAQSNVAPLCDAGRFSTVRDAALRIPLRCTDPEGGPVRLSVVPGTATLGAASGPDGADWDGALFGFVPTAGRTGEGGFTVVARDDQSATTSLPVHVAIDPPDKPVCPAAPVGLAVRPGKTLMGVLACRNAVGFDVSGETGGAATVTAAGAWTFRAGARATAGGFTVTPRNVDGVAGEPVRVSIDVDAGANHAPACTGSSPSPGPRVGETVDLDVVCGDADDDPLTADATDVSGGTAQVSAVPGGFRVRFAATAVGDGTGLTLHATDSRGAASTLRLDVAVRPATANAAPTCDVPAPLVAYTGQPAELDVAGGCADADRDPLTVTAPAAAHGTLGALGAGRFRYLGSTGGEERLAFRVGDGHGGETTRTFVITVVAGPDTELTRVPPAATNSTTATLEFRSPNVADATFECRRDGAPWTSCRSPLTLTGLSATEHALEVRARDGAAADASPATATWTVDTTPPAAPVLTQRPPARSGAAGVTVAWTLSGGTAWCALDGGEPSPCSSPLTLDDQAEGAHDLVVSARDAAGNAAPAETLRWTIDRTGPAAPTLTGAPDRITNARSVTLTVTPAGATAGGGTASGGDAASWQCRIDAGDWAACAAPVVVEGLADGAHSVGVRGVDDVGNPGAAVAVGWTQDTEAPAAPALSGVPDAPTTQRSVTPRFVSASPDVTGYRCTLDAGRETTCATGQTFTGLEDGSHTLVVAAVDAAGNRGTTAATWTVDGTPPPVPVFGARPAALTDASAPASLAWSSAGADRYECRLDGAPWAACTTSATLGDLADGTHDFSVRAVDAVGNRSASATATWRRDRAALTGSGTSLSGFGVTVTSPTPGDLGLLGDRPVPAVAGWTAVGPGVLVSASVSPLRLEVAVPDGLDAATLGAAFDPAATAPLPSCTNPTTASPDPCVATRTARTLVVLTTRPGTVTLIRPTPATDPAPGDPAGTGPTAGGAGGAAPGAAGPTGGAGRDTTPPRPRVTVPKQRLARALMSGLRVTVACDEPCAAQVLLRVDGRTARKLGLAKRAKPTIVAAGAGTTTVVVRFTKAAAKRLRRARSVKLAVQVAAKDAAGNAGTTSAATRLRR